MKNDKRRITAAERVDKWIEEEGCATASGRKFLIKMLGDHVKAAHKRHARKNVCFRPEQVGYEAAKGIKNGTVWAYTFDGVDAVKK